MREPEILVVGEDLDGDQVRGTRVVHETRNVPVAVGINTEGVSILREANKWNEIKLEQVLEMKTEKAGINGSLQR